MSYQRLADLVDALKDSTDSGRISWDSTVKKGVYQATFPNYSIQISRRRNGADNEDDIVISIFNDVGEVIEQVDDLDLAKFNEGEKKYFRVMSDIYDMARRQALGADKAVESILSTLKKP